MESVEVWRGEEATDVDGNAIHSAPTLWKTLSALVAPLTEAEVQADSGRSLVVGYTVYVRGEPTGIIETDSLKVRGEIVPVTGRVAEWVNKAGAHIGDVITITRKRG